GGLVLFLQRLDHDTVMQRPEFHGNLPCLSVSDWVKGHQRLPRGPAGCPGGRPQLALSGAECQRAYKRLRRLSQPPEASFSAKTADPATEAARTSAFSTDPSNFLRKR